MSTRKLSRRTFFGASAAAGAAVVAHPVNMAAQAAGVKAGDMPDLTIKEAKIYVLDAAVGATRGRSQRRKRNRLAGDRWRIEGNFTLGNRGNPPGWVDFAKANCVGKNVFDILPTVAYIPLQNRPGGAAAREQAEPVRLMPEDAEHPRAAPSQSRQGRVCRRIQPWLRLPPTWNRNPGAERARRGL